MKRIGWLSLAITSLLLAGCTQFFTFSPESAAIQSLVSRPQKGQVLTDTIEVLQTKELNGNASVMLKYQISVENRISDCVFVQRTQKRSFGWVSRGGGGGCSPGPFEDQQVSLGGGTGTSNGDSISRVYGLVYDQEIKSMEVRWNDEMVQREEVINDSFLAIRKGKIGWSLMTGYDANDNVIYSWEPSEPPPGKN